MSAFCVAAKPVELCLLWVKSRHRTRSASCPLYPKADIGLERQSCRFVPKADIRSAVRSPCRRDRNDTPTPHSNTQAFIALAANASEQVMPSNNDLRAIMPVKAQ